MKSKQYDSPWQATWKGVSDLFKKQERVGRLSENDRLEGKTILITGSSSGLGLATATELARRGGRILMAVRSGIPEKGEQVKKSSGSDQVEMLQVDLSDVESIEKLVQQLKEKGEKLDQVICNAAVVPRQSRKTKQGLEEMFMVNYLSKFILLNRFLEEKLIRPGTKEDPSRIIIVSSESHRNPTAFEWESFGSFKEYGMQQSVTLYGYYKLLLTTFARELSRRLKPGINVYSLCPGPVNSNIAREAPNWAQPLMEVVFSIFFRSPEKAREPAVYFAASPDVIEKDFDYLFLMGRKEIDPLAEDPANGKRLWELSEDLMKQIRSSGHRPLS